MSGLRQPRSRKRWPELKAWKNMIQRCYYRHDAAYRNYGGRGIQVCDRWRYSFAAFVADLGLRPSQRHSLDRIDCNGHYEPGNCRWATARQQARNRRTNRDVTIDGVTRPLCRWVELSGLCRTTVQKRLDSGWDPARAVFQPARPKRSRASRGITTNTERERAA